MKLLAPTASRRWNELIGLFWAALALLLLLSLVSYSSTDRSWNTASASPASNNWVGPAGAFAADLFYQLFGFCAFLFPIALAGVAWIWLRSRPCESPWFRILGALLLLLSLGTSFSLIPYSIRLFGVFPLGGLLGLLLAEALRKGLNGPGSAVLLALTFLSSLYLLTTFSLERTSAWLSARFGWFAKLRVLGLPFTWAARKIRLRWSPVRRAKIQVQIRVSPRKHQEISGSLERPEVPPVALAIPIQPPVESSPSAGSLATAKIATKPGLSSRAYKLPSTNLLHAAGESPAQSEEELKRRAAVLTMKCEEFDVRGAVTQINPGPVVTTFEFKPEPGVKYNRVTNLAEDLCLALEAESVLIERIPGKSTVGIEVPNMQRETIVLREMLESEAFIEARSPLTVALGKEINGRIRIADLASMPHLLMAGSTGSGKSVSLNGIIISLLFRATPDEVKLMLVDPKRLELGLYEGIPHLLTPIITDPKVAANALRNVVREMERRLKLLAEKGVRNIEQYNRLVQKPESLNLFDAGPKEDPLPLIVICIDELADLMMVDKNVEIPITRLAQMARAVGIHLVLATQRPSVDVITGLIKANFPARISFRVATKVDSRTILDSNGAESLLGKGDMLFSPPGSGRLVRVHGPLITEEEIAQVVEFWRAQATPSYADEFLEPPATEESEEEEWTGEKDDLYEDAVRVVVEMGKASTSILQRRLRLGYGRAARLLDIMEKDGIIGPPDGSRPREVLKRPDWVAEVEQSRSEL
ncbi:MAG: DNA translocase FtsK 4TM domain-containing protein [Acidobacteria bacterium]|nr:DNA translocase FtsK 4TM domain-containing protein [Acidobacteriota bacterium]